MQLRDTSDGGGTYFVEIRIGSLQRASALAALLGSTGCATLQPIDSPAIAEIRADVEVPTTPALAAWLAADLVRTAYPNTDSQFALAGVPVYRSPDGSFCVELAGTPTLRVATNGRLLPPRRNECVRSGRSPFADPEFLADVGTTRAGDGGQVHLRIVIAAIPHRASTPNPTRVRIYGVGGPYESRVVEHLLTAMSALDPTPDSGCDRDLGCCAAHLWLRAPKFAAASREHEFRGDLALARIQLSRAVDCSPDSIPLRARLAELDERLHRSGDARRRWREVGAIPMAGWAGRTAAARAEASRRDVAADPDPRLDPTDRDPDWRWIEQLAREPGSQRQSTDWIESLIHETTRRRDAAAALRILARHWTRLRSGAPDQASTLLAELTSATGDETAARILRTERRDELARVHLERWRSRDRDPSADSGTTLANLWARLDAPHVRASVPVRLPVRSDYPSGPGLAAPAR